MNTISSSVGRGGINRRPDVEIIQTLLNKHIGLLTPLRPLKVDGRCGAMTISAIEIFQQKVVAVAQPDGRVDPHGRTLRNLTHPPRLTHSSRSTRGQSHVLPAWVGVASNEASWIAVATSEIGQKERLGYDQNNPRILEYIATFPYLKGIWRDQAAGVRFGDVDETAWCACFVNWCLIRVGRAPGPSAQAKDWLNYGTRLDVPVPGAITVIYKKPVVKADRRMTSSGYHVGFFVRNDKGITLLGGNQNDKVVEKTGECQDSCRMKSMPRLPSASERLQPLRGQAGV